jgi:GMP synthase-like glutamine amidotransferase
MEKEMLSIKKGGGGGFEFLARMNIIDRMRRKNTRLAIIDNSLDPSIYNPILHWKICLDRDFDVFRTTENNFPDIKDFTHIILTGSEASILNREGWVEDEIQVIKEAAERGISLLGSCYGHQLLAVALAGARHVRECAHPEIGWIAVDIIGSDDFLGRKRCAYCFSSHLDEVVDLPEEFLVFASSKHCLIQAFRLRNTPIWGLQIHPEMNIYEAQKYLRKRVKSKHEPLKLFQEAMNSSPRDSGLIHHVIEKFFT